MSSDLLAHLTNAPLHPHKCAATSSQMRRYILTNAPLHPHKCAATSSQMRRYILTNAPLHPHKCTATSSQMRRYIFTNALLHPHKCAATSSQMRRYILTNAPLHPHKCAATGCTRDCLLDINTGHHNRCKDVAQVEQMLLNLKRNAFGTELAPCPSHRLLCTCASAAKDVYTDLFG
jgi:uncharacterized protein YwbE